MARHRGRFRFASGPPLDPVTVGAATLLTRIIAAPVLPLVLLIACVGGEALARVVSALLLMPIWERWQEFAPGQLVCAALRSAALLVGALAIARYVIDSRGVKVMIGYWCLLLFFLIDHLGIGVLQGTDHLLHFHPIESLVYGWGDPFNTPYTVFSDIVYVALEKIYWTAVGSALSLATLLMVRPAVASVREAFKLRIRMTKPFFCVAALVIFIIGPGKGWYFVEQCALNHKRRERRGELIRWRNPTLYLVASIGALLAAKLEVLPAKAEAAFDELVKRMRWIGRWF